MRAIKFKAKTSDGEWVEGSYIRLVVYGVMKHFILPANGLMFDDVLLKDILIEIDPNTLCQFTGITDKNGKEIYEGDIIRIHEGKDDFKETHLIWDNDWCLFVPSNSDLRHRIQAKHSKHYEVIGNIHDNKEER